MDTYDLTNLTTPTHQYDIILKNGRVLDPERNIDGILDVALADGKIAAVEKDIQHVCYNVVDCTGKLIVPGIIDSHLHCYPSTHMSTTPETGGIYSGVPTVVDGGSAGYMTFPDFYNRYITKATTDVYALLHIFPVGQYAHGFGHPIHSEPWDSRLFKMQYYRVLETVEEYRGRILGLKNRAIDTFFEYRGLAGLDEHLKLAEKCGLPYVVHIGEGHGEHIADDVIDEFTRGMLERLRPGDIITHAFTGKRGNIFREDGKYDDLVVKAVERGVILDACTGRGNFSLRDLRCCQRLGLKPDILSSDRTWMGLQGIIRHFGINMSRFVAMGFSLKEVVAMSTIQPAKILGLDATKGMLEVGRTADISVFDYLEGEYTFAERIGGEEFKGDFVLSPAFTVREGRLYHTIHKGDNTL